MIKYDYDKAISQVSPKDFTLKTIDLPDNSELFIGDIVDEY